MIAKMRSTFDEEDKAKRDQKRIVDKSKFKLIYIYILENRDLKYNRKLISKL